MDTPPQGSRQQRRDTKRRALKAANHATADPNGPQTSSAPVGGPKLIRAEDLDDRKIRGIALDQAIKRGKARIHVVTDDEAIYWSSKDATRAYSVVRRDKNDRGELTVVYRCNCQDSIQHGRSDCEHCFAERVRRKEVIVVGEITQQQFNVATSRRRPARKRKGHDGRPLRTAQRLARVKMPGRIPELTLSLREAYDNDDPFTTLRIKGGQLTADSLRAVVLLLKIAEGKSADAMVRRYQELIERGSLQLERPPHQNTLTEWMNDAALTPVLQAMLRLSSGPFCQREIACIIDSSKVSQLRTAHARLVDYGTDERPSADWMKAHTLIGLETMVVMAVTFSGTKGDDTHDINFIQELVEYALKTFELKFLLADKAYLSDAALGWLWKHGLRAVIPVKKRWDYKTKDHYEAAAHLANWYDKRRRDFDEVYRLRSKIEGLFSLLKRMANGFCWSRGRPRGPNAVEPCTAWKNETLAKFIYLNLRATVSLEEETGVTVNYLVPDRRFPKPAKPLLRMNL